MDKQEKAILAMAEQKIRQLKTKGDQKGNWGDTYQNWALGTWIALITEELGEAAKEYVKWTRSGSRNSGLPSWNPAHLEALREELSHVAAYALMAGAVVDRDLKWERQAEALNWTE